MEDVLRQSPHETGLNEETIANKLYRYLIEIIHLNPSKPEP